MKPAWSAALILAALMATGPVAAQQSERLYAHKSWVVEGVTFDDGSVACLAEVSDPGESFTIWVFPDHSIQLQFYSEDWDFGEGDTADLEVEIDHRSPWTLTDADLHKNSVLFNLPDADASVDFVVEVAKGNILHLRSSSGEEVRSYSLAGSSASINALVDCGNAISSDGNPFN